MRNKKNIYIIDALIVLLNIAVGRGNFLGNWLLFTSNSLIFPILVIILDITYLIFRNRKKNTNANQFNSITPWLIWLILLFYNFFSIYHHVTGLDLPTFEYAIVSLLLFFVLKKQASSSGVLEKPLNERVYYLSRGYLWLSMISIIGVFSSFLLYRMGLWGDTPISADFTVGNEEMGNNYSRVFISVRNYYLTFDDIRVPFFQDNGIFCGLFHEPHIIAYNVFPCLILLLGFYNRLKHKFIIILSSVLMLLFAGSATNVLVVLACVAVYLVVVGRNNPVFMFFGAVIVFLVIVIYISIDDTFLMFVLDRLDGSNASNEYSQNLLKFAFSPESIIGFNFLNTEFMRYGVKSGRDVGYIAFFLNILFLYYYIKNTILLIFKKEAVAVSVGFASLYCILHSAKIGMTMYGQILPLFLVLLQCYVLTSYGRVKSIKRN